jgi:cyclopropane fatty-acyl-phospholipid synthase-like methyltransferase
MSEGRKTALENRAVAADKRMFSPSAARNKGPILEVLARVLPAAARVLEIGAGTGEHAACFARALPGLRWRPSDPDAEARASIAAWIAVENLANVSPPLAIDAREADWPVAGPFDAIVSINMIHIAAWDSAIGLFAGAGRLLRPGGILFLYGPFMRDGAHTAPSNAAFDASLQARNPDWGVRDIAELENLAAANGLALRESIAMPANNLCLVFAKS